METRETAVFCRDLVKVYSRRGQEPIRALSGLSLLIERGEIFGILGRNGAGKTTLLRILTTLIPPTSGTAEIMGHDVVRDSLQVRKQLCVVLQESAVEVFLSVLDNFRTYALFHSIPRREFRAKAEAVMDQFGLTEHRNRRVIDLSGGLKRRVQVAKVFMVDKPVVFLDEATTGMDPVNKRATLDAIREQARQGRTIVLTTHILQEAEELCDRIAIIDHGALAALGDLQAIKALASNVYDVSITFESLTGETLEFLRSLPLIALKCDKNTATFSVKGDAALGVITTLSQHHRILHFEAGSASLEDVFLELLDRGAARP
jgi:ABC-2 type transport system ATP-binding protein